MARFASEFTKEAWSEVEARWPQARKWMNAHNIDPHAVREITMDFGGEEIGVQIKTTVEAESDDGWIESTHHYRLTRKELRSK